MLVTNNMIPHHIYTQISEQTAKVEPLGKVSDKSKNINRFINQGVHTDSSDFAQVLLAILQNPNIDPKNVKQNILLAKEYCKK